MDKKRLNYYLRGTGIILVIWVVILVSCYGVANNANANVRKIFYICFFSVMGASLIGYWVYAFLYEKKHNKEGK
jgi:uncharacterized membrane protein